MTRILCKGGTLIFADNFDWNESPNISDYDLVFLNLRDLEKNFDDYVNTDEGGRAADRVFEIADPAKIVDVVVNGGDVYAILPQNKEKQAASENNGKSGTLLGQALKSEKEDIGMTPAPPSVNFFNWVPTAVDVEESSGKSVDESSINPDWEWYFTDRFEWNLCLAPAGATRTEHLRIRLEPLVVNRYGKQLGSKLVHSPVTSKYADQEIGSIYFLPKLDGWEFEDIAEKITGKFHPEVDTETVVDSPEWSSEYSTPRQSELEKRIEELKAELQQEKQSRTLLTGQGDELEETVHNAFRELGFEVEGEKKGRRDGLVFTENRIYVLETHGTKDGIEKDKLRQLHEWQEENEDRWEKPLTGIYVVNPKRYTDPKDRVGLLNPDLTGYADDRGQKILQSPELFRLVSKKQKGEIGKEDIESVLDSQTVISASNAVE